MSRDVSERVTRVKDLPIDELTDAAVWGAFDRLRAEHQHDLSRVKNGKLLIDLVNGRLIDWVVNSAAFGPAIFEGERIARNSTQWLAIEREAYAIAEKALEQLAR